MSRKRTSRRKAFAAALLAGAVVLAIAASQSFAGGASHKSAAASGVIVDGTTDTVVNIDPANQYDYGSFTLDLPLFQGLYGFPHGAKLQPVLATGCKPSSGPQDVDVRAAARRQVRRRHADDLGRRQVVVRPRATRSRATRASTRCSSNLKSRRACQGAYKRRSST